MDSMRSLNTSLPPSQPIRPPPPEQLLQAFKTAALSVTNLYKTAVTDQASTRQAGYQDALDDLLVFLDRENLGLREGEGWKVRQWAMERFERAAAGTQIIESDDDRGDTEKRARSSSPVISRKAVVEQPEVQPSRSISPVRIESVPPPSRIEQDSDNSDISSDQPSVFRFTATQPASLQDIQMQTSDNAISNQQPETEVTIGSSSAAPVRLEVVNRGSRTPHRHGGSKHHTRSTNREFTFTAGTKRRLQFPDFFDISNMGNGKDTVGGGGKRGRFV